MEAALLAKVEITPADFQALMQQRATRVQSYLVETGHVPPEQLSLAAPKPVDATGQGKSRVNLTLQ